jgi:co-chaperonin GroES (HSP10)
MKTVSKFGSEEKEGKVVPDYVNNFSSEETEAKEDVFTPERLQEDSSLQEKLPVPTGYRILMLPFVPGKVTRGGIHLAKQTVDKERLATVVGYVVKLGPDAYKDDRKFPEGPWCQEGDWVIFGRYAGARIQIEGGDLRLLNDDEILAVIDNPEDILAG